MKGATLNIREAGPGRPGTIPGTVPNKVLATDANGKPEWIVPTIADYTAIEPLDTVSTASITLSGIQTLSGVAGAAGLRVGVAFQSNATQNGVYEMAAGAWSRAADFSTGVHFDSAYGREALIKSGTFANGRFAFLSQGPHTLGSTQIKSGVSPNAPTAADAGKNLVVGPGGVGLVFASGAGQVSVDAVFLKDVTRSGVPAAYDDVTFSAGMSVLLVGTATPEEDRGPWVIQSGVWTRPGGIQAGMVVTVRYGGHGKGTAWKLLVASTFVLDDPTNGAQVWERVDGGLTGKTTTASTSETLIKQIVVPLGHAFTYQAHVKLMLDDLTTINKWPFEIDGYCDDAGVVEITSITAVGAIESPVLGSVRIDHDTQLIELYGTADTAATSHWSVNERLLHAWDSTP